MPKIEDLLRKSKYYLINVHQLGQYFVRENEENDQVYSEKIVYIGGIEVEIEGKIKQKTNFKKIKGKSVYLKNKIKNSFKGKNKQIETLNDEVDDKEINKFIDTWIKEAKCLVIFNMGTAVGYEGFSRERMRVLVDTFEKYNECRYIVENGTFEINDYYNINLKFNRKYLNKNIFINKKENILLYYNGNGIIDKQEILSYTNVVCYITDGGQKSFNEALYAGVPLLVIPSFGEQYFNATLTKYMQIGITMNYEDFFRDFSGKFKEMRKQVYFLAKYFILLIFKRDRYLPDFVKIPPFLRLSKALYSDSISFLLLICP
uniref:glucuronosyltransferase n=1 Tax=Meloidogyne enterolobii TaxID=390850 RepID=A0A6V7TV43_MELEN|nr:unnamed protein product [Meloidogyne enterolobii]